MQNKLLRSLSFSILLASMLTSCSVGNTTVAADSTSSVGEQTSPPNSASVVRCNASSQEGYYHSDIYYGEGASICYLDYETMQDVVLCSSPNCAHNSDEKLGNGSSNGQNGGRSVSCISIRKGVCMKIRQLIVAMLGVFAMTDGTTQSVTHIIDCGANFNSFTVAF